LSLDEIDKKILNKLQEDARKSFREIAEEAGLSEAAAFVRVKKLQESGFIKGFKAIVDPEMVGKKMTAIILLKADPKKYPRVLEELKKINDVYEIYDVTGSYYSILKVRTENTEALAKIIDRLGMVEGIVGTETAVVLRVIKEEISIRL
jgi:Lrp/AsnC family transcriptional regulator for asnA, asnC and gidA